jgi:hypothetical protein
LNSIVGTTSRRMLAANATTTVLPSRLPSLAPTTAPKASPSTAPPTYAPPIAPTTTPSRAAAAKNSTSSPSVSPTRSPTAAVAVVYTGVVIDYSVTSPLRSLNASFIAGAISSSQTALATTLAQSYPGISIQAPSIVNESPTSSPTTPLKPPLPKVKRVTVYPTANNATVVAALQAEYALSPATLYCLALNGRTAPTSTGMVRTTGTSAQYNPGGPTNVTLAVVGLKALQSYRVYCYLELSNGDGSPLADVVATGREFNTTCCKSVTFTNAPVSVFGDISLYTAATPQTEYFFAIALESAPAAGELTVTPRVRLATGVMLESVNSTPSVMTFRSSTPNQLTAQFFLSAYAYVKGVYVIDLVVGGAAKGLYFGRTSQQVTVLSSSQPLPAPRLVGAVFADSGGYVTVTFNTPTDQVCAILRLYKLVVERIYECVF